MTIRTIVRWCAALLLTLGMVGCQSGDDAPPRSETTYANWPKALDGLRFRWSAEPGIDLLLGPAVPLRAYLESHRIGDMTFDADNVYPGFKRAVPQVGKPIDKSTSDLPFELWSIQPFTDSALVFERPTAFYGNEYFHILELTPIQSGGYRAYVCDGLYGIFHQGEKPNSYVPLFAPTEDYPDPDLDNAAINVWRVEFTDHPIPPDQHAPPMVTVPQKGPNPAPLGDVFGPWHITGASPNTSWGPTDGPGPDPRYRELRQRCLDRMPHDAAQRQALYTSQLDTAPTAEPAAPGWPGNTA